MKKWNISSNKASNLTIEDPIAQYIANVRAEKQLPICSENNDYIILVYKDNTHDVIQNFANEPGRLPKGLRASQLKAIIEWYGGINGGTHQLYTHNAYICADRNKNQYEREVYIHNYQPNKTNKPMKVLRTKSYFFGITTNADNTLNITAEYVHVGFGKWENCHSTPWDNAAALIGSFGGVDKLLARCQDVDDLPAMVADLNEYNRKGRERQAAGDLAAAEARRAAIMDEYAAAFGDGTTATPSTLENIRALLRRLNLDNWGSWTLPPMTVGYACHQYDCDGHTATTIKLDQPVEGYTMLQYGAPRGHLTHYTHIDRAILNRTED